MMENSKKGMPRIVIIMNQNIGLSFMKLSLIITWTAKITNLQMHDI